MAKRTSEAARARAVAAMVREQLALRQGVTLHVVSGSMQPLIRAGDRVVTVRVVPGELVPGEIISFQRGGRFCTHRFVTCYQDGAALKIITKGDNQRGFDRPVDERRVIGKVTRVQTPDGAFDLLPSNCQTLQRVFGRWLARQWRFEQWLSRFAYAAGMLRRLCHPVNRGVGFVLAMRRLPAVLCSLSHDKCNHNADKRTAAGRNQEAASQRRGVRREKLLI